MASRVDDIQVKFYLDTGPCDVSCDLANTNGIHVNLSLKRVIVGGTITPSQEKSFFLCEHHAKVLVRRMLKELGVSADIRKQIK